ncbi:DNA polymerase III subunit alpha [Salinicoccus jeotgali]|uniref:DNA-directed DNA polymerase n=1 Tax=Salinicoccus jeotgali TaxID=381634 RepID=A0ABP7EY64_9STAP
MINLNVHSCYEFLDSNIKIGPLLDKISRDGQKAVALTDFNRLHGVYEFYTHASKSGIKPLIGMEVSVDDQMSGIPLVLIAKDLGGYKELIRLSAMLSYKNLEFTPVQYLNKNIQSCVAIAKNEQGIPLLDGMAIKPGDKYISHHLSHPEYGTVFINPAHYMEPEDLPVRVTLNAIRDNEKLDTASVHDATGSDHIRVLSDLTEIEASHLKNNQRLVEKCNVEIPRTERTLPHFPNPQNEDSKSFLWQMLKQQLESKTDGGSVYRKRLEYEYGVIVDMGYEDYFLIVQDAINHAKRNGIYVGPGRGSSSASLVSYLLNITEVDPLQYNLLFERFLNPERVTMPDIDIDFEDARRDEVVDYLIEKYGTMNVAHIVTYGTLSAKMAARDVGRVLGFKDDELKMISGLIPETPGAKLQEAFQKDAFRSLSEADPKYVTYASLCKRIEGLPRHTSTHAAGILLSAERLTENIPVTFSDGHTLSQWTMNEVEPSGLLKIDVLGLRNLTLLKFMVNKIEKSGISFNLDEIPDDDPAVYRLLGKGMTIGIFQLESDGISKVIREMQPEGFLDLVAVIALYRPGPMKEIPNFIAGKQKPDAVRYPHEDIKDILKETYGVIVYQEQIMQIASRIAGYSYAEADILRRAMSKKDRETLEHERGRFEKGAESKGYASQVGHHIFNLILEFADYGFPKSHAVAYSRISYTLAYIKTHYPEVFYSVILTHHFGNEHKVNQTVSEIKRRRIPLFLPNINSSLWNNRSDEGIELGFSMIKGVTYRHAEAIIKERENGPFSDIYDLKTRVQDVNLDRKVLTRLVQSGALDVFEENRKTLLNTLPMLDELNAEEYAHDSFLSTLGFNIKKEYHHAAEMDDMEKVEGEKDVFGFYLSDHPVIALRKSLQFIPFNLLNQSKGIYLVFLDDIKVIRTKNGQNMAFVKFTDGLHEMEGVVFPKVYFNVHPNLTRQIAVVEGRVETRRSRPQLIVDSLETVDAFKKIYYDRAKQIVIRNAHAYNLTGFMSDSGIPVKDFDKKKIIGKIGKEGIEGILEAVEAADIRILN